MPLPPSRREIITSHSLAVLFLTIKAREGAKPFIYKDEAS